jgi:hypothetical protein
MMPNMLKAKAVYALKSEHVNTKNCRIKRGEKHIHSQGDQ